MSCSGDCMQGRQCICRKYTINTVNDEITMFNKPWQWLTDIFYTAVLLSGSVALGLLLIYFIVLATGLYKIF